MRNAFAKSLFEIIEKEKSSGSNMTFLMTGDLGFSLFDKLREDYSERFINMSVSEQNMIGAAAGMAMMGKNVFVYSIIPFLLYRPFEQIRNDICYHNLPVRLIGFGANFSYPESGATHHPFEDLKIADALPNLTILSPSDPKEVEVFMHKMTEIRGPVYMRLSRTKEQQTHNIHNSIQTGKALKLASGSDILIVATGALTNTAVEIAKKINTDKADTAEVLEIHTFKPFDHNGVMYSAEGKKLVVTIEDNTGALAEKVASTVAGREKQKFLQFKFPDKFTDVSGSKEYLLKRYGLSETDIYNKIIGAL